VLLSWLVRHRIMAPLRSTQYMVRNLGPVPDHPLSRVILLPCSSASEKQCACALLRGISRANFLPYQHLIDILITISFLLPFTSTLSTAGQSFTLASNTFSTSVLLVTSHPHHVHYALRRLRCCPGRRRFRFSHRSREKDCLCAAGFRVWTRVLS